MSMGFSASRHQAGQTSGPDAKGEPHLTDFGLARLVETENTIYGTLEVMGTRRSHMAPEQAAGKLQNSATPRISMDWRGALPTAHWPSTFCRSNKLSQRSAYYWIPNRVNHASFNLKIDRELSTICLKCLEKD